MNKKILYLMFFMTSPLMAQTEINGHRIVKGSMTITGEGGLTITRGVSAATASFTTDVLVANKTILTSTRTFVFDASALQALETNFSVLESTSSAATIYLARAYDDTTREYANGFFTVPYDIDPSGTITIRLNGRAKTAASANTRWALEHIPLTDSESLTTSYRWSDSGDLALDTTAHDLDQLSWTMSVSSSTWASNDALFFRLSRDPAATSDLTGDFYLKSLSIDIPLKR